MITKYVKVKEKAHHPFTDKWKPCRTLRNGLGMSQNATKAQSIQKKSIQTNKHEWIYITHLGRSCTCKYPETDE